MIEKTILFSGEMVLKILHGVKTQTRRVVKFPHTPKHLLQIEHAEMKSAYLASVGGWVFWSIPFGDGLAEATKNFYEYGIICPYGVPGDQLSVSKTIERITLEIINIRVERVQDISLEDCKSNGVSGFTFSKGCISDNPPDPRWKFIQQWDSINSKRGYGWNINPWVWVIDFKVLS
jgi:hypothetical protein